MKTASILGVHFHAVTLQQAVELAMSRIRARQKGYVVTPNPEIVDLCRKDSDFMRVVNHAALVLPDGIGIIYAAKILGEELCGKYPGLVLAGTHDGYFSVEQEAVEAINACGGADAVFVCLGAPKQEKFISAHIDEIHATLYCGLGGSLDVFAGEAKRAPDIFIRLGLEWFYRLLKQPSRIGRMMKLPKFLLIVFRERLLGRKGK